MSYVNRRTFLAGTGVTLCSVGLARMGLGQNTPSGTKSILRVGHPRFSSVLASNFPGLASAVATSPFAVLITNNSQRAATAYALTWRYESSIQGVVQFTRMFAHMPTKGTPRIRYTGNRVLLKPGEVAIVTPTSFLSATKFRAGVAPPVPPEPGKLTIAADAFISGLEDGTSVYSSLQAKVSSATAWGSSPAQTAALYTMHRAAEQDEATALYQLLSTNAGLSITDAVAQVRRTLRTSTVPQGYTRESYLSHRRYFGAVVAKRSASVDRAKVLAVLAKGSSLSVAALTVSNSVQQFPWGYQAPSAILGQVAFDYSPLT